jgi:hypothetical protein
MRGPLKDLLEQMMRRSDMGSRIRAASVVETTKETAESLGFLPKDLRILSYRDGIVSVACANGAVAQAFRSKTETVIETLKRRIPEAEISELRIRVGMPPVIS